MATTKNETPAQLAERFLTRTCISIFLLAVAYTLDVIGYFTSQAVQDVLDAVGVVLSVILVINVLPVYGRYLVMRRKTNCSAEDGYIVEKFKMAVTHAFTATFITTIWLEVLSEKKLADIPTHIILNGLLALSLLTLSISFFLNTRDDGDEEDADDFDAEDAA